MELSRRDSRAMIYYDYIKGLTQECFEVLVATFGEPACLRATVFNWFAEFKRERREALKMKRGRVVRQQQSLKKTLKRLKS